MLRITELLISILAVIVVLVNRVYLRQRIELACKYQLHIDNLLKMGRKPMAAKKVVIVKGSPRKNGNSAILADQVAAGAESAGAQVDVFYLHGMDLQPCDACESCRASSEDECIIDDDMQAIYPKLREADSLVIASPIYWFTVSAQTKIFLDRCYALGGGDPSEYALKGKQIGILLAYGDTDPFTSGAINALRMVQDAYNYIGAEIVGMVYASAEAAGEIRNNEKVMVEAKELGRRIGSRDKRG
jgi:multimeric flavodoxin WrbA